MIWDSLWILVRVREPHGKNNFNYCKQFNLGIFLQMAISLLAYVATFSGQLYFWRTYFFTLLWNNYSDTKVTFLKQLFLPSRYFFWKAPFSEQSLFHSIYCFRIATFSEKLLPSSNFLRIGISLGKILCRNSYFLVEELVQNKDI